MSLLQSLFKNSKFTPTFLKGLKVVATGTHEPQPKKTLHSLPNELLLEIFSFLELKSYIMSHAVRHKWRKLLPSTKMDPIRQRFLDLYHTILSTPNFEKTFEWTDQNLQPFDREEYIRCLLLQYPVIPDEFRMWILEWPARLAIQCMWPGLPFVFCVEFSSNILRRPGVNWIAYRSFSPLLSALVYQKDTSSPPHVPALLIWRNATVADWLCFDQYELNIFGRVFRNDAADLPLGSISYLPPPDDNQSYNSDDVMAFEDWIDYLEFNWSWSCDKLRSPSPVRPKPDLLIPLPIFFELDDQEDQTLPAPAWIAATQET